MYKTKAAIISLPEAKEIGLMVSTLILIAKKDEPHIALKIMRLNKLDDIILFFKN